MLRKRLCLIIVSYSKYHFYSSKNRIILRLVSIDNFNSVDSYWHILCSFMANSIWRRLQNHNNKIILTRNALVVASKIVQHYSHLRQKHAPLLFLEIELFHQNTKWHSLESFFFGFVQTVPLLQGFVEFM